MGFNAILTGAGIILLVCFGSILFCAILGALGFQSAGVLAGSCASAWQSVIGNVAKGTSIFVYILYIFVVTKATHEHEI